MSVYGKIFDIEVELNKTVNVKGDGPYLNI